MPALEVIAEPTQVVAVVTPPSSEPPRWSGKRKAAVVAASIAVLGAATGALLGVIANHERHDADQLCPELTCATGADVMAATSHLATAHDRALEANLGFGIAGAAAIAATILWLTSAPERTSGVAIAPAVAPGTLGLTVTGGF